MRFQVDCTLQINKVADVFRQPSLLIETSAIHISIAVKNVLSIIFWSIYIV